MPDNLPLVKYPRTPGYQPGGEENQYNAWYVKTEVKGASQGKLQGKTVVLKDNVMLAGVPMMNGSSLLEGYVPDIDATIVTRLLDAGTTIVGKAQCTDFCMSGSSHSNAKGPIHNPHKMGYSAGGSSAGSAVLVAAGEVDFAIGGDQVCIPLTSIIISILSRSDIPVSSITPMGALRRLPMLKTKSCFLFSQSRMFFSN